MRKVEGKIEMAVSVFFEKMGLLYKRGLVSMSSTYCMANKVHSNNPYTI